MNNDLISREALKEYKFTTQTANGVELEDIEVVPVAAIDNAPTVDAYPFEQVQELVKLNQQFAQEIENLKRPKGEWVIDGHHYKCSRCGKTLAIMFSETDDDDLIGCPFCLADMRVKGERPQTIGCFNCKHDYKNMTEEPCKYCNEKFSEWEAEGGRE